MIEKLRRDSAWALAWDAGNRHAQRRELSAWDQTALDEARKVFERLWPIAEDIPSDY